MEDLKIKVEDLLHQNKSDFEVSKLLKKEIKTYFGTLEESFRENNGKNFLVKHTKKIDTILQMSYRVAMRAMFGTYMPMKSTLPITLVALGSYGREQLCVYSDIDLMIVYKEVPGYNTQEMIEKILYILWDAGLKLGHRVHEVDELFEVSKTDITIKTSFIESRFIEGSKQLWNQTQNELHRIRKDNQETFIAAKIEEMKTLHEKYPMTMEPNLKEGVGGFRNANLVYWIGNILYNANSIADLEGNIISKNEYEEFREALYFLFKVRSALHLATGKKEDKLRLELIPEVAKYLGYDDKKKHMKFSRKVISHLKTIKLYSTIWVNALSSYGTTEVMLQPQETNTYHGLLKQLSCAKPENFPVHPTFLKALTCCYREDEVEKNIYGTIYKIFEQPQSHLVLNTLIDARLLGYTIPYMKKAINLPQFDGYHQYAVGIHTVKCIEALENIKDDLIRKLYDNLSLEEQVFLKTVVLIHDAGKGRRKDHHEVGTVLFKGFSEKLGYNHEFVQVGKNLILYHTLMSITAQREDLHSEQVILKFSSHFPTQKELNLIYILTYADMNGVGKDIYNNFSASLIYELYTQSSLAIKNVSLLKETAKRIKKEKQLQRSISFNLLPRSLQKKTLSINSDMFFIKNTPQEIINIVKIAQTLKEHYYSIKNEKFLTLEIYRKDNLDLSFLLQKLSHLNIVHMDIHKLFSNIKYFRIDFAETIEEGDYIQLNELMIEALTEIHKLKIAKPKILAKDILINCEHSQEHSLLKINCLNQKGLLSYIINLFDSLGVDISSAKIHTKQNRINDLFLIEKNGNFCNNTHLIIKELTENE
ncbi:MAG: Possible nucleotidyltransferase [uncultured Sulfurovum sp.]|uniref:Bifunctional uridylyltransferase/uridylyl-removing enzyme n=1 Tax=uncultured Sulfurovum sp. TaxID=269237 RepID=A0A6S6S785_9BACT|nr:MAG: Possible nucleotidyltransferase [uncultured Sulfurovum sp.]